MVVVLNLLKTAFYRAFSCVIALLLTFSNGLNNAFNGSIYAYETNSKVIGLETLERAQGVTTDGKAWYFSGKTSLVKIDFDNQTLLACNYSALDGFKEQYGSAHIGGISYYDGKIYASLEDSKVWAHPVVAVYSADDLKFTGISAELPSDILVRGLPWVAVDAANGLLYTSHSREVNEIHCFDLESFEYVKALPISETVNSIQGGEVYNGLLYVGTNDSTRAVYTIDVKTGRVVKLFDRIMYQPKLIDNFGGEGEDVTVYPMEDGTLIHALDVGVLFIDSNLRHYKQPTV